MNFRVVAVIGLAVALVGSAFVWSASAAPPQPYNLYGLARQSDGATPLAQGTRITGFIDGVDYSNGTSVYTAGGNYDVDVFGDWVTGFGDPNTPEVKEGGNVGDEIMYVAGDFTNTAQVMTTKKLWTPGDALTDNIQVAPSVNQPGLLKIARIVTRPADLDTQYLYICNPTSSPIDSVNYYLQKDTIGQYLGPTHVLSGTVNPGALLYVNLTGALTLVATGDNLKLVWDNFGPAFLGTDIIIDRVEFNQTSPGGTLFWEPGNTLMTDAVAPGLGQEIRRSVPTCVDTNNNALDFTLAGETGRPGLNTPPTVTLTVPDGGQVWTGGTSHGIQWTMNDAEDTGSLGYTVHLSTNAGTDYPTSITTGNGPEGGNNFPWTVNPVDTTLARVRVCVTDSGGLPSCDASAANFEIDSTRPALLATIPADLATSVDPDTNIVLTFSEGMTRIPTETAVTSFPGLGPVVNSWDPGSTTLTINPNNPLSGPQLYTVTVGCGAIDDSDTGNQLASCPRVFTFTTDIGNVAPTVDLTFPDGGQRFSGGTSVRILFTLTDPDTTPLTVDIAYSTDGGGSYGNPIATGLSLAASPSPGTSHFRDWTTPPINDPDVRVQVCASDGVNPQVCDASAANFAIDSVRPTVTNRVPAGGAINVLLATSVVITFSESMHRVATEGALTPPAGGLAPNPGGIVFLWSTTSVTDDTLTVSHSNAFQPCTEYTVTVAASARDLSDPGNTLLAADSWSFNTACAPTVLVSSPSGGEVWSGGSSQDVSFSTTDTDTNVRVWVNISIDGGPYNPVSGFTPGSLRATGPVIVTVTLPTTDTTQARIQVTAQDSTFLDGVATSPVFRIDATAPTVSSTNPTQGATGVDISAAFTVTFSEAMDEASAEGDITLVPAAAPLSFSWNPSSRSLTITHAILQTSTLYTLTVGTNAQDASIPGNALANPFTLTFTTSSTGAVTADAGGPYSGPAGTAIPFIGSNSVGAIVNYTWQINLTTGAVFVYGENPSFRTSAVGTFEVTLIVRDASGNTHTDTTSVTTSAAAGPDFLAQYWWVFLILILAIVGGLLFLVLGKRRKKEEEMPPEVPPEYVETIPAPVARAPPPRPAPARPSAPPRAAAPPPVTPARASPQTRECPSCGTIVDTTDTECFMCGAKL